MAKNNGKPLRVIKNELYSIRTITGTCLYHCKDPEKDEKEEKEEGG